MKKIVAVVALATLGGCAVYQPGPANYVGGADTFDPYQWHTVSQQPVYAPRYNAAPVYAPSSPSWQPYYAPQPSYYAPRPYYAPQPYYAYPPVTIGLDFLFRGGSGHRGRGGYGHRRGYGR
jgi:hypothetical protein